MNILITGGYGFIGNHVAERFYKEGHKVHIIDLLKEQVKQELPFKHKFYQLDVRDPRCEEIFKKQSFDQIIHLAEAVDTEPLQLIKPVVDLAIRYEVPKFIYLSSTEIYGEDNEVDWEEVEEVKSNTLISIEIRAIEDYLSFMRQKYNIKIHILRVSHVYAPLSKRGNRHSNQIYNIKEQFKDYIYIGDVVEAIYKASEFCKSPILNVCSGHIGNGDYLKEQLGLSYEGKPRYLNKGTERCYQTIQELNWFPRYSLEDGVKRVREYGYQEKKIAQATRAKKKQTKRLKKFIPYIENILSFGVVVILTRVFNENSITPVVDLNLIYITVIAMLYGMSQSFIAVALGSILFVGEALARGEYLSTLIYDPNTLLSIGLYIFVGGFLGYILDSKKYEITEKENEYNELKEKFDFIYEFYNDVIAEKKALEYQIVTSEDSFGKIYSVINELDSLNPEKIFEQMVTVLEQLMKVEEVAIYTISQDGGYLRLRSHSNVENRQWVNSFRMEECEGVQGLLDKQEVFINKNLKAGVPMMVAPIVINGRPLAIISIDQMEFKRFNHYTQNLFKIITELITNSLLKAHQYEELIAEQKYVKGTSILLPKYFEETLRDKQKAKEKGLSQYRLLAVYEPFEADVYEKIKGNVRDVDYIGVNEEEQLFVLLSNTDNEGASFVINRLEIKDVRAEIVSDEVFFNVKLDPIKREGLALC